jgi:hypothetical protein
VLNTTTQSANGVAPTSTFFLSFFFFIPPFPYVPIRLPRWRQFSSFISTIPFALLKQTGNEGEKGK